MARMTWIALAASMLLASCSPGREAGKSEGPGDFQGTYSASLVSNNTYTEPAGTPPSQFTVSSTIAIGAGKGSNMLVTFAGDPDCTLVASRSGTTSTFAANQACTGTVNGAFQTTTISTGSGTVSGAKLILSFTGTFEGTNQGAPYAGNYSSTWTATRIGPASAPESSSADDPPFLAKHFRLMDFHEIGPAGDHTHRSNLEGNVFSADSRNIGFDAPFDLPLSEFPDLKSIGCTIQRTSPDQETVSVEIFRAEAAGRLSLTGTAHLPASGWKSGRYVFTCVSRGAAFLTRDFVVE